LYKRPSLTTVTLKNPPSSNWVSDSESLKRNKYFISMKVSL